MYGQDANGVSHFSVGDVFEAKRVANRGLWYVRFLSPKNMKIVPLNRHKTGLISSYRGLETTNRKLSPRSIDSEGGQILIFDMIWGGTSIFLINI